MLGTAHGPRRSLHTYSLGILRQTRLRRILALAGYRLTTGWPGRDGAVAVWGQRAVAARGRWVARRSGASLLTVEDGFLRSVAPGVSGAPPLSLVIDDLGIYYDAATPSRLERLISDGPPDGAAWARARHGIEALRTARLSKYTPAVPQKSIDPGFVLVVDQTRNDASIRGAGADAATFQRMLQAARAEHPDAEIVIKAHPDTRHSGKTGHFQQSDCDHRTRLMTEAVNPWDVLAPARAVYTVSSQLGYEALLAGRPVRTFGAAFYAGWGLTMDETQDMCARRSARPDAAALFWACHLTYPFYYDPWRDCLCDFETVVAALCHERNAAMAQHPYRGEVFSGVRLWKRRALLRFRPHLPARPRFVKTADQASRIAAKEGRAVWHWAAKSPPSLRPPKPAEGYVEDGFLRSVGLGATLTEAASLVFDRRGVYFDPGAPSDLEDLIGQANLTADLSRARRLRETIVSMGVTKYNVGTVNPSLRDKAANRPIVLVPGQVEDDASIVTGSSSVRTNLGLLQAVRAARPDAWIVYKPHPDVEAGLRTGTVAESDLENLADHIARDTSSASLLDNVDALWTITSLMGFEALLRRLPVTCLGAPFYAGWGLTTDLGPAVPRRVARPSLDELVWAALIAYPSYRDPVSGLPCPPELIVERLAAGIPTRRAGMLSRLQGLFAAYAWIWR